MKVYIVYGYTMEDYQDDWAVFGAYATRKKAEEKLVQLAGEACDANRKWFRENGWTYHNTMTCDYYDGKLREIYEDRNYGIILRITEEEIEE